MGVAKLTRAQGRFTINQSVLGIVDERTQLSAGASANTTGTWTDVMLVHPFSITISGSFIANVTILVANDVVKPDDTNNNYPRLGVTLTGPDTVLSDGPYRWVKVVVDGYSTGTVFAWMGGAAQGSERG